MLGQMLVGVNGCRMVTIFPVSPVPILLLIELLSCSPRYQLDGIGDHVSVSVIPDKKMNMIGGDRIIQDAEAIALPRLKQPLEVTAAVAGKFQEEFLLMTPMGDMPNTTGYVMPVCPWHSVLTLKRLFPVAKPSF
jgi:hypothetical protein